MHNPRIPPLRAVITRKVSRTLAVAVALTVGLAACSSGSSAGPSIASLASPAANASASTGGSSIASSQQALLDYAQCMREQGVDMPDPRFGADGRPVFGSLFAGLDTSSPEYQAAYQSCSQYLQGVSFVSDPAQRAEQQARLLAFTQCMRADGIDIPDPQPNPAAGPGGGLFGGSDVDVTSPEYQAAYQACAPLLSGTPTSSATAAP